MALTPDDLKSLVAAFEASDWSEMSVRLGDTTLELTRTGRPPAASQPAASASAPEPTGPSVAPAASPAVGLVRRTAPTDAQPTGGTGPAPGGTQAGGHVVTAPSLGLFWRSPQPGAPPFVAVGQVVDTGDTVCIVEVMKLMNHVMAGVSGTVVAIEPDDGQMVEFGQRLVVVQPAG